MYWDKTFTFNTDYSGIKRGIWLGSDDKAQPDTVLSPRISLSSQQNSLYLFGTPAL